MNRFKCPACGGNQYTSADTAEGCIYCGHQGELEKMLEMEPEKVRVRYEAQSKVHSQQQEPCTHQLR
jgi:hypothetical protein